MTQEKILEFLKRLERICETALSEIEKAGPDDDYYKGHYATYIRDIYYNKAQYDLTKAIIDYIVDYDYKGDIKESEETE